MPSPPQSHRAAHQMGRTGGSSPVPAWPCTSIGEANVLRHADLRPSARRITWGGKVVLVQHFKGLRLPPGSGATCISKQPSVQVKAAALQSTEACLVIQTLPEK